MINFEQFNKKSGDKHNKCSAPISSTNNMIDFPVPHKHSLVSCEEVGHWVDRLMELPEVESSPTQEPSLKNNDEILQLAERLVNLGLV